MGVSHVDTDAGDSGTLSFGTYLNKIKWLISYIGNNSQSHQYTQYIISEFAHEKFRIKCPIHNGNTSTKQFSSIKQPQQNVLAVVN